MNRGGKERNLRERSPFVQDAPFVAEAGLRLELPLRSSADLKQKCRRRAGSWSTCPPGSRMRPRTARVPVVDFGFWCHNLEWDGKIACSLSTEAVRLSCAWRGRPCIDCRGDHWPYRLGAHHPWGPSGHRLASHRLRGPRTSDQRSLEETHPLVVHSEASDRLGKTEAREARPSLKPEKSRARIDRDACFDALGVQPAGFCFKGSSTTSRRLGSPAPVPSGDRVLVEAATPRACRA